MIQTTASDEALRAVARQKIKGLLLGQSFLERWLPVTQEGMLWVLLGPPDKARHKKVLPDYCYHIFELYRRTLLRTLFSMPETIRLGDLEKLKECKTFEEAKSLVYIDWEKVGSISASGLRVAQFIETQLQATLEGLGIFAMSESEMEEFSHLFAAEPWLDERLAKIQAQDPGKPVEEIIDAAINKQMENVLNFGPLVEKIAFAWGPEALASLRKGQVTGAIDLLDDKGEIKGERRLKHFLTYLMLLLAWPEIEAMIRADPPQRMEDLWNWLAPFSYASFIEIRDLDQLVSLCRSIKLKLKKPGAPRKSSKARKAKKC